MRLNFTLLAVLLCLSVSSFAQFSASDLSIGVAGNYTAYKGDFKKSTPGVKLELAYGVDKKVGFALGFTKGAAIKNPSSILSSDGQGNSKITASEISTNFSTISLNAQYRFIGDDDGAFKLYAPIGASYVSAKSEEKSTEAIPAGYTAMDQMESETVNGLTINLGLGAHYRIGAPIIFAEGQIALPANKVNNGTVENYIPAHFLVNVGVRISFGSRESND